MTTTTDERAWMTDDQLEAFARGHFAAHPNATPVDVCRALLKNRDDGGPMFHWHHVAAACDRARPLPILDTAEAATRFLTDMVARGYKWVAVFWDRGWGDDGEVAEITVIQDGDGQLPLARVTPEVYQELRETGVIDRNSLRTYKARRVHDFVPERAS